MQRLSVKDIYQDESYYSGAQAEPVSLAEAKAHLFIESSFTTDDTYLTALITQARNAVENFCNISIQNKINTLTCSIQSNAGPYKKDWDRGFFNNIPYNNDWFELPYGPIKYVLSVTGVDQNTVTNLAAGVDYFIQGAQFKDIQFNNSLLNFIIVYQTGWPVIPPGLKLAILNEIAFRYENRGDNTNRYAQQNVGLCEASEYLAFPFKRLQA